MHLSSSHKFGHVLANCVLPLRDTAHFVLFPTRQGTAV
jgi:hypothetical protein